MPGDTPMVDRAESGKSVSPAPGPALRVEGLTKRFGEVIAVDELTLEVPRGTVFGFLGPNGAGKTTTIGMLLGLVHPTRGRVEVLGGACGRGILLRCDGSEPWWAPPR